MNTETKDPAAGHQSVLTIDHNPDTREIHIHEHIHTPPADRNYHATYKTDTDRHLFRFIQAAVGGLYQGQEWEEVFTVLLTEYPELAVSSYEKELEGKSWREYRAIRRRHDRHVRSLRKEITARFKELAGIRPPIARGRRHANP